MLSIRPEILLKISALIHLVFPFLLKDKAYVFFPLAIVYFGLSFITKYEKIKKIKDILLTLSFTTITFGMFFFISENKASDYFSAYLIVLVTLIPFLANFIRTKQNLNIYIATSGILVIAFISEFELNWRKDIPVLISFLLSLFSIYYFQSKKLELENVEKAYLKDIKKLVQNFGDVLIRYDYRDFHLMNHPEFVIEKKLKDKMRAMIHSNSSEKESVSVGEKTYQLKLLQNKNLCIIHCADITDNIERIKELEQNRQQLANSNKLAALGEMAGGVAHEINNPLQILSLSIEQMRLILLGEPVNKNEADTLCNQMESTVDRINNIVKGMKLISRDGQQDPYEPIDMRTIAHETLSFCREKFKNNGVKIFVYEEKNKNFEISAQRVRLSQVVLNILQNAHDAISENNTKIIRISLGNKDGKVFLAISDNGPGVPEAIAEKIFQPFFTTKQIGKGTGLGLSISKSIIEQHKGIFRLDETDRSKFIIELPEVSQSSNKEEAV